MDEAARVGLAVNLKEEEMDRIDDIYRELMSCRWHNSVPHWAEDRGFAALHHTAEIMPVMGHTLLASKAHGLVSAMASFCPPAAGHAAHGNSYSPWITPILAVEAGG